MDRVNAAKTYCSGKWVLGFLFIIMNVLCHSLIVPFCDLTLLSCNAATAIIVNMLLSINVLGERFVWQYDLTAMILIATGSVTIVMNAHTEQVNFDADEIYHLLIEPRCIIYLLICILLFTCESCMMNYFYRRLREFEQDCNENGLDMQALISERSTLPQELNTETSNNNQDAAAMNI